MRRLRYIAATLWREASMIARLAYGAIVAAGVLLAMLSGYFGWGLEEKRSQGGLARFELPWWQWGEITIIVALGVLLLTISRHAYNLDEKRRPKLQIRFKNQSPFNSTTRLKGTYVFRRLYRVEVYNDSDIYITNAKLYLEDIIGYDHEWKHRPLKQMNDGNAFDFDKNHREEFELAPRDNIYFDVVWANEMPPLEHTELVFCFARHEDAGGELNPRVSCGEYTVPLKVVAKECAPTTRQFRIAINNRGRLEFGPLDEDDENDAR